MKLRSLKTIVPVLLIMLAVVPAHAQKASTLKSHKVTVDGTSSLHDFTSDVTKVAWAGSVVTEGKTVKSITGVTVTMNVESIKSTKGDTMDEKTYEAFNSKKNPNIIFKLTKATITGNTVKADGTLTMNGVAKPITMNVASVVQADGTVKLTGSQELNMKDHKMVPPKAVMGTIKVGEKVKVNFELVVIP
jgi:polyisoprenoid-binding protein YceI